MVFESHLEEIRHIPYSEGRIHATTKSMAMQNCMHACMLATLSQANDNYVLIQILKAPIPPHSAAPPQLWPVTRRGRLRLYLHRRRAGQLLQRPSAGDCQFPELHRIIPMALSMACRRHPDQAAGPIPMCRRAWSLPQRGQRLPIRITPLQLPACEAGQTHPSLQ